MAELCLCSNQKVTLGRNLIHFCRLTRNVRVDHAYNDCTDDVIQQL